MIGNASANFARDLANPDFNIFLISQSSPLDPIIPPVSRTVIFFLVFQIQGDDMLYQPSFVTIHPGALKILFSGTTPLTEESG